MNQEASVCSPDEIVYAPTVFVSGLCHGFSIQTIKVQQARAGKLATGRARVTAEPWSLLLLARATLLVGHNKIPTNSLVYHFIGSLVQSDPTLLVRSHLPLLLHLFQAQKALLRPHQPCQFSFQELGR